MSRKLESGVAFSSARNASYDNSTNLNQYFDVSLGTVRRLLENKDRA